MAACAGCVCLHTHLGGEGLTRDDKTDLLLLRLDAMVTIGVGDDGLPTLAHTAALRPATPDGEGMEFLDPPPPAQIELDFQAWVRDLEEELSRTVGTREVGAVVLCVAIDDGGRWNDSSRGYRTFEGSSFATSGFRRTSWECSTSRVASS